MDECKKCMMDRAHGYDWMGTRVRASSYALSSSAVEVKEPGSDTMEEDSAMPNSPVGDFTSQNGLTVKSLGTIVDYCPGIDEHFILFDEEFMAPRWLSLKQSGGECDVEVILQWAVADGDGPGHATSPNVRCNSKTSTDSETCEPKCELCRRGTILGVHGVVTCSVCGIKHLHRHCMPMSRMQLSENQDWRCWHCTCKYKYFLNILVHLVSYACVRFRLSGLWYVIMGGSIANHDNADCHE
jgi:hypothetical protein